jgi:hypothetical protein
VDTLLTYLQLKAPKHSKVNEPWDRPKSLGPRNYRGRPSVRERCPRVPSLWTQGLSASQRSLAEAERYTKAAERKKIAAAGMQHLLTGLQRKENVPLFGAQQMGGTKSGKN